MAQSKTPLRKCVGCFGMMPKDTLVRVVKSKEGTVSVDYSGKKAGRGAYICLKSECFDLVKKARKLEKAFCCRIPPDIYTELEEFIRQVTSNK